MLRVVSDTKVPIKIWASNLEAEAEQQVRHVASLPFIAKHVAVMADAHAGKGSNHSRGGWSRYWVRNESD
jgi:tRNA-splicing ligase RtcB